MHRYASEERVILDNGVLCRVVTAIGLGKFSGYRLVVAKIYEDGRQLCRNIDLQPTAGWCIEWPGEKYRPSYGYGCLGEAYKADLRPFRKPYGDISGCSCGRPDEVSKAAYIAKYPEFRWILAKSEMSNTAYFHLLPYWKKHPHDMELLLSAGYFSLALDGRLWNATDASRKAVLGWLRAHRAEVDNPSLDGIRCCIRYGCSYGDWCGYHAEISRDTRVDYDVYRWLKDRLKRNRSLWAELRQYRDYADMVKEAGHDLRDRYWRFPKSLKRAHDKVMAEVANIRAAKKAEDLRQKGLKYLEAVKAWIGSDMELKNGWRVYVPESAEDIVRQADALKQCLVSADYIGKVIKGECVLVFVRFRGRPVATAEILPGGKLGQFYGNEADRNRCKPTKAATVAFDAWKAEYIDNKKKKNRHRKEAA